MIRLGPNDLNNSRSDIRAGVEQHTWLHILYYRELFIEYCTGTHYECKNLSRKMQENDDALV